MCEQIVACKSNAAIGELHHMATWGYIASSDFKDVAFRNHPELLKYELSRICKLHAEICYLALATVISKVVGRNTPFESRVDAFLASYEAFDHDEPREQSRASIVGSSIFKVSIIARFSRFFCVARL